jgi:hypothetical protein
LVLGEETQLILASGVCKRRDEIRQQILKQLAPMA